MTEIKVGDKISVSGYGLPENSIYKEMGITLEFNGEKFRVHEIIGNKIKFYAGVSMILVSVHRKQCRKLVKMRKCDECGGHGVHVMYNQAYLNMITYSPAGSIVDVMKKNGITQKVICSTCNGKGRVKV